MHQQKRKKQEILRILSVLGAGFFGATVIALLFLYIYSASGEYTAGSLVLSPSAIQELSQPVEKSKKKIPPLTFDHIEWEYTNVHEQRVKQPLSLSRYQLFYDRIKSQENFKQVPKDVVDLFYAHPATLTLFIRSKEGIFPIQKIEVVKEDYFRIYMQEGESEWFYFYHASLYEMMMEIFNSEEWE